MDLLELYTGQTQDCAAPGRFCIDLPLNSTPTLALFEEGIALEITPMLSLPVTGD
jgi:hypothetical protein